ncbi:MAG: ABC transporter ATP-binding protein [Methanobacteriota archaeon]|nr:MAG: ABC transporter ATP-binding protein [Euryarchaeota archaeon]
MEVDHLKTYFDTRSGTVRAVDDVSWKLEKGESLGLAGESGCGKTTTALSIIRLLPKNGRIIDGHIRYSGKDLATIKESELRRIRWKHIAIVFQGAMNALNPVKRISWQIAEAIALHDNMSFDEAQGRVVELLELVGINPSRKDEYPHEFSGGMRQRVMIAMALACRPKIIIADEPVTALDVMIQAQILELLTKLQKELDLSMILISHDLSVIAQTCNNVAIMYGGKIAEYGPAEEVFLDPQHPYTQGLLRSFPDIYGPRDLPPWIPGQPPNLLAPPDGCRFHERCPLAFAECLVREPPLYETRPGHLASCHLRAPST